jgi:hypothetical protein
MSKRVDLDVGTLGHSDVGTRQDDGGDGGEVSEERPEKENEPCQTLAKMGLVKIWPAHLAKMLTATTIPTLSPNSGLYVMAGCLL